MNEMKFVERQRAYIGMTLEVGVPTARARGELLVEANYLQSVSMAILAIAVSEYGSYEESQSLRKELDFRGSLRAALETTGRYFRSLAAGSNGAGGTFNLCSLTHCCWLEAMSSEADEFLSYANAAHRGTPFWIEYARGLDCLAHGRDYIPRELKLKGQEVYWATYLRWIAALVSGGNGLEERQAVIDGFRRRQQDKRIRDDNTFTEGCSSHPVRWDYRMESIVKLLAVQTR
jgi:hypothetical protein